MDPTGPTATKNLGRMMTHHQQMTRAEQEDLLLKWQRDLYVQEYLLGYANHETVHTYQTIGSLLECLEEPGGAHIARKVAHQIEQALLSSVTMVAKMAISPLPPASHSGGGYPYVNDYCYYYPSFANVHYELAKTLFALKQFDAALVAFRKALEWFQEDSKYAPTISSSSSGEGLRQTAICRLADCWFCMGVVWEEKGFDNWDMAQYYYQKAQATYQQQQQQQEDQNIGRGHDLSSSQSSTQRFCRSNLPEKNECYHQAKLCQTRLDAIRLLQQQQEKRTRRRPTTMEEPAGSNNHPTPQHNNNINNHNYASNKYRDSENDGIVPRESWDHDMSQDTSSGSNCSTRRSRLRKSEEDELFCPFHEGLVNLELKRFMICTKDYTKSST